MPEPLNPPTPADMLESAMGHLGAAITQSLPSDDAIIMEHVRVAHELVTALWRANR